MKTLITEDNIPEELGKMERNQRTRNRWLGTNVRLQEANIRISKERTGSVGRECGENVTADMMCRIWSSYSDASDIVVEDGMPSGVVLREGAAVPHPELVQTKLPPARGFPIWELGLQDGRHHRCAM